MFVDLLEQIRKPIVVLGQTHPAVREHEGESYRTSLQALVVALGMQRNVAFVDSYLGLSDLLEYLAATA